MLLILAIILRSLASISCMMYDAHFHPQGGVERKQFLLETAHNKLCGLYLPIL